ncbi:hypothetical protein CEXT_706671 [Caerostris extrusa]|uniref:Uncharacterized protein n=1 Tax=Caerostris extrusa TaxID=172846 RepID=A0AAV4RJF5_CAEEX|nr:hypothetical protein CEXT_706671 [Caerostris extrusa]
MPVRMVSVVGMREMQQKSRHSFTERALSNNSNACEIGFGGGMREMQQKSRHSFTAMEMPAYEEREEWLLENQPNDLEIRIVFPNCS